MMKNRVQKIDSSKLGARSPKLSFAFFGTPELAAVFLDDLEKDGLVPPLVVTTPDTSN